MSNVSSIYVPAEGPKDAKIVIVGEAPGADEEENRRPFVGRAGQFLERYLGRCGISRDQVFFTNLCKNRPKGNKFQNLIQTDELESGLAELRSELEEIKPNIIIACGAWPMYFLTGLMSDAKNAKAGSGISQWRGSVVPSVLVEGIKVLPTFHPAYLVRPQGFVNNPIFLLDLKKAVAQSAYPDIRPPIYEEIIDPSTSDLGQLVKELSNAEFLTVDIETFGPKLACIGFADSRKRGVCLTVLNEEENWSAAREILASNAPKNFQFGAFDINYLSWFYGWRVENFAWDTYVAANSLMPTFPKGLDFLTSIYTDLNYYKTERKDWKQWQKRGADGLTRLWKYNIKDVIATHWIAEEQKREIAQIWKK